MRFSAAIVMDNASVCIERWWKRGARPVAHARPEAKAGVEALSGPAKGRVQGGLGDGDYVLRR